MGDRKRLPGKEAVSKKTRGPIIRVNPNGIRREQVCQVRFQNVTTNTGASSSPVTSKEPVTNCKAAKGTVSGNGK